MAAWKFNSLGLSVCWSLRNTETKVSSLVIFRPPCLICTPYRSLLSNLHIIWTILSEIDAVWLYFTNSPDYWMVLLVCHIPFVLNETNILTNCFKSGYQTCDVYVTIFSFLLQINFVRLKFSFFYVRTRHFSLLHCWPCNMRKDWYVLI